jgi:hypothetical protein
MAAWFVFAGVQTADDAIEMYPSWKEQRMLYYPVRTMRWVLPKTQDIAYLAERWTGAGSGTDLVPEASQEDPDLMERTRALESKRRSVNPVSTIGASLAFEAVIVVLAMWSFARKDY